MARSCAPTREAHHGVASDSTDHIMRRLAAVLLALALLGAEVCDARGHGSSSHSGHSSGLRSYSSDSHRSSTGSGSHWVNGYTRRDGTYVPGHFSGPSGHASFARSLAPTTRSSVRSAGSGGIVARDSHGRIIRNQAAKQEFMRQSGFPHGRPSYVVDHIVPLKRGGCDCPSNMQWQTVAEAKAKDKWE
jgi:hypothetical protein